MPREHITNQERDELVTHTTTRDNGAITVVRRVPATVYYDGDGVPSVGYSFDVAVALQNIVREAFEVDDGPEAVNVRTYPGDA